MDVDKVFHMNGGIGVTSYAKNSSIQKQISDTVNHITVETFQKLYLTNIPNSIEIADLGCSTGHNSLITIKQMVKAIGKMSHNNSKAMPEFRVHLNDLPSNDFSVLFSALPEFYEDIRKEIGDGAPSIYVAAYPGSFYGRLFPKKSLHFVYTCQCLHWLSRVPPGLYDEQGRSVNKTSIYISESSPPQVIEAYYSQFQEDMSLFLRSRAEEVVGGGKMVLILQGRIGASHIERGNNILWDILARCFNILISLDELEEEKLESYNLHYYLPSKSELEFEVKRDGSFEIDRLEMFEIQDWNIPESVSFGTTMALAVRAAQESSINHHFGDKIIDNLFKHYARLFDEEASKGKIRATTSVVVLTKKIEGKQTFSCNLAVL